MNMPMEWHIIRIPMRCMVVFIPVIKKENERMSFFIMDADTLKFKRKVK